MTRVVDQPVLVLNRHWQPVAVFTVGVAITSVLREMAQVVDPHSYRLMDFETWCSEAPEGVRMIKTPSGGVPAPEIVVLCQYGATPRRGLPFSRRSLYRRDEYACQYCGRQPGAGALTIDHVLPRSRGGGTSWENCVAACAPCNHRKADRTPREAGMRLRNEPRRPRWKPALEVKRGQLRPSWSPFVAKSGVSVLD